MPLNKKLIFIPLFLLFSTSILSGCVVQDLLFGTSFDITSYSVTDSEGFPALKLYFTASDKVNLKTYNAQSEIMDSNYFYSDANTTLNIGTFHEDITNGVYKIKVYDDNDDMVYDKEFSFTGSSISINSCDQRWWKNDGVYFFMGLEISITNIGDTPCYPDSIKLVSGDEIIDGLILPDVVLPGSTKTIYSYLFHEGIFESDTFDIELFDKENKSLAAGSFSFNVEKNVSDRYYYNSIFDGRLSLPYIDFLHTYYLGLERIYLEDYSLFIFDKYDDEYIDFVNELIISNLRFGKLLFMHKGDVEKVEYINSFVQGLDYKKDSEDNNSVEYPRYPVETLFNDDGGGDCEDKAILSGSLLTSLDFETALIRLPEHMAIGIKLGEDAVNGDYFREDYDYLETTTPGHKCGDIPENEYNSESDVYIYPIEDRPLLVHNWKDGIVTTYKNTKQGDMVKVISYIENLGTQSASNIKFEGLFTSEYDVEFQSEEIMISELKSNEKIKVIMTVEIPQTYTLSRFETRIYLNGEIVDSEQSKYNF